MKKIVKCPQCGTVQKLLFIAGKPEPCFCGYNGEVKPLKAISIKQPFAWFVVNGFKPLENRNTLKNFKGDVLIHTGKKWDDNWMEKMKIDSTTQMAIRSMSALKSQYPFGGIVGVATFTGSITESDSAWFVGKYAFQIENAYEIDFIKCKGKLGFFYPKIN